MIQFGAGRIGKSADGGIQGLVGRRAFGVKGASAVRGMTDQGVVLRRFEVAMPQQDDGAGGPKDRAQGNPGWGQEDKDAYWV